MHKSVEAMLRNQKGLDWKGAQTLLSVTKKAALLLTL